MKLTIGRTVSGPDTLRIDNPYVSGEHCKIFLDEKSNIMYIEDLGSSNGTYLNGVQVMRYSLKSDDDILLGGKGGYRTSLGDILKLHEAMSASGGRAKDDQKPEEKIYDKEFAQLKKIYDNYQKDTLDIKDKMNSMMMWRFIPTTIMGVITAALLIIIKDPDMKIYVPTFSAVATVIIIIVAFRITGKLSRKYNALLLKKQEDYQLAYVCPKCRRPFNGRAWVALEQEGCCPACRAKFKK